MVSRSNGILGRLRVLKGRFGSPSVRAITVVTLISVLTFTGAGLSGLTSADQTKASQESNGTRPANGRAKEPARRSKTRLNNSENFEPASVGVPTGPVLATADFNLIGLAVTAAPASQTVPVNTPTVVNTSVQTPSGVDPSTIISQLNPNYRVMGELSGPSFSSPQELSAAIGQPLQVPALTVAGDHVVQNLRVVDSGSSSNPVVAPFSPNQRRA